MVSSRIVLLSHCVILVLGLSGCANYKAPFKPPNGLLYGSYRAPVQIEYGEKGADVVQTCGTSSASYFQLPLPYLFWLSFAWNDCSVEQAAKNGGLAQVNYADVEYFHILSVFGKTTYRAYGSRTPQAQ